MGALSGAIVIGGGPAGCAAAIGLVRGGVAATVVERERGPAAKVCGEFLSVEACAEAASLGVDPFEWGAAPIDRVRVAWGRTTVESRLPFRAASLSRAVFDEALLRCAERAGARVLRGTRAVRLDGCALELRDADGGAAGTIEAASIVLASGKSEFEVRRTGGHFPGALGFKMHLGLPPRDLDALGTAVELTLFDGGYYGMQRIENDRTAFALVISAVAYRRFGSYASLLDYLAGRGTRSARRLTNATELWAKPLAVSGVPYGFTYRTSGAGSRPDVFRTGDQLAVIPSFTGDGMAIALVSGSRAGRAIARGMPAEAYHTEMRARLAKPMRVAGALSRAIRSPLGRAAVVWPARLVPGIFSYAARLTRIEREDDA